MRAVLLRPVLLLAALLAACASETMPHGLTLSAKLGETPGPTVVFQPLDQPEPLIPLPNDLVLTQRADGTRHWNVSTQAPTKIEQTQRRHLNDIEGFSGLTPITIQFDAPLDVSTVTDQTVFVVNVTPDDPVHPGQPNPRFGERLPLDLGRGWFPQDAAPHAYLPLDPYEKWKSYVLPPDNTVDTNGDGTSDKWLYHYEVATHTLDIRPIVPLQSGARYAVVLTRGVKGWAKDDLYGPIRSPWRYVNHDSQTADLEKALPSLAQAGVKRDDIAFAWTLTAGDLSKTFRALRDGLYGKGAFAWLNEEFPAKFAGFDDLGVTWDADGSFPEGNPYPKVPGDSVYVLQAQFLSPLAPLLAQFAPGVADSGFSHVSHFVFGDIDTPNLRATPDNVWELDPVAGTTSARGKPNFHEKIPFLLIVPKTTAQHKPPFPVTIYAHATGTSRIESLLLADRLAEAGIAVFAVDAVGHGPILTDPFKMLTDEFLPVARAAIANFLFPADKRPDEGLSDLDAVKQMMKNGFIQELTVRGRATDDNGDCVKEGGEAYYAPDAFRLRDAMRQTTLDNIVAVRVLHALEQAKVPAKPTFDAQKASQEQLWPHLMAGDFDLDGVLDVGGAVGADGKQQPYFMMGVSLGGIHTALTSPLEPYITAAAPVVPGAGLADIFIRTKLHDKVAGLMEAVSGPMLVGCPAEDGGVDISWNNTSNGCKATKRSVYRDPKTGLCSDQATTVPVALTRWKVTPGATVRIRNMANGGEAEQFAAADGSFRLSVASDKGDVLRLQVVGKDGKATQELYAKTPTEGLSRQRTTPGFRRFVQLAANILEGADAITVADRMFLNPLPDRGGGQPHTNILMMLAVNDRTVPFTQGVALARTTGLFGRPSATEPEPYRAWTEQAIASGLLEGQDVPPPVLDASKAGQGDGLCRLVPSNPADPSAGQSALCLAHVHGHHEYIAQANKSDEFPEVDGYQGTYSEFHRNLIVNYFHSLGRSVTRDLCWGDAKCVQARGLKKAWELPVGTTP
jgi:hypothetical protein